MIKRRRSPVRREPYHLKGGPYDGKVVRLEAGATCTLAFSIGGLRGRYVLPADRLSNVLHWKAET